MPPTRLGMYGSNAFKLKVFLLKRKRDHDKLKWRQTDRMLTNRCETNWVGPWRVFFHERVVCMFGIANHDESWSRMDLGCAGEPSPASL